MTLKKHQRICVKNYGNGVILPGIQCLVLPRNIIDGINRHFSKHPWYIR